MQERQNRLCTSIAIAIVAEACEPFTVLPALMNEYRLPEMNVQNGVLKALSFMFEYIGEAAAHSTGIYHYPMADLVPDLKYYGEGDTLPLGSLTIKVLATPGHTLGGVTLLVGDAMFPGDTLFAGSMGRTDLPGGNDAQMLASLRRLAQIEGDYTVYPGHMNATTLAREKAMNPYLRHALR